MDLDKLVLPVLCTHFSKVDEALGSQLLSAMLPVGSQLLETQTQQEDKINFTSLEAFEDFFDSLVLLAGTNKSGGHLTLAKAVEKWIPPCFNLVKSLVEKGQATDEEGNAGSGDVERKRALIPVGALFRYLSHLTSAVQFVDNMVKCTEKRTMAGEYDGPLHDSDSEDEGEGIGGGELDEDSLGEDSVSIKFLLEGVRVLYVKVCLKWCVLYVLAAYILNAIVYVLQYDEWSHITTVC